MFEQIHSSWQNVLVSEFDKPYFQELNSFVDKEYATATCHPNYNLIFSAFDYCKFDDLKVVIIGQDPYHGLNQANGLCFSVNDEISFPPSLQNIFKEIQYDLNIPIPKSGNLIRWANQGILLLNATLTVRNGVAGSHQKKGWETFTDEVIKIISDKKENVVFLLWGGFAKKKGLKIDRKKHYVLETGHPSPLSANRGLWFGNNHFSKTNTYLKSIDKKEIAW
ncbi:uracil-DNA glycosylase [Flavobacterium sp. SUN052]|uniref:uracil-DNA glycosylase n=1 Tax=Flavobacterium sp. SUN052 TaxID=3002441 RepID=UPI00237E6A3C|nr:uracil-DNA glycosylase [Flavobacterium sp. SUN052]MEC4005113.1 uracil-DNA glycosylase [Flavobacterium sp. SUN052]